MAKTGQPAEQIGAAHCRQAARISLWNGCRNLPFSVLKTRIRFSGPAGASFQALQATHWPFADIVMNVLFGNAGSFDQFANLDCFLGWKKAAGSV
jgi:hypothetical protein